MNRIIAVWCLAGVMMTSPTCRADEKPDKSTGKSAPGHGLCESPRSDLETRRKQLFEVGLLATDKGDLVSSRLQKDWTAELSKDTANELGDHLIVDGTRWTQLWKQLHKNRDVPPVDFRCFLVCWFVHDANDPNKRSVFFISKKKGRLSISSTSTLIGFSSSNRRKVQLYIMCRHGITHFGPPDELLEAGRVSPEQTRIRPLKDFRHPDAPREDKESPPPSCKRPKRSGAVKVSEETQKKNPATSR